MAKEKDKGAKAAPVADDLVEKPREPMFSKTGMIVFVGTVVLVAVFVAVVSFVMFSTTTPSPGDVPPDTTPGGRSLGDLEILPIPGISAQVKQHGGQTKKIRFNLNITFAGEAAARLRALEQIRQAGRLEYVKQLAEEVVREYDYEQIIDSTFPNTFERHFRDRFNTENTDIKIGSARAFGWEY